MSRVRTAITSGVTAGLLAGLVATAAPAHAARTLVFCAPNGPETLNPQLARTQAAQDAALPVYDTLIRFERGGLKLVPGLALSWTQAEDGALTVKLRPGVKWHAHHDFTPTRDLNADDIVFTFNRMLRQDHPFHKVSGGGYEGFREHGLPDLLKSVEKIDDLTVRFTLARPDAPFLADLALPFAAILSAEYGEALLRKATPERIDQIPIGTGAFEFVAQQKNTEIRYKAFEASWSGRPAVEELVFAITPDPALRYAKLKTGACQVVAAPNPADIPAMRKDAAVTVEERLGLNVSALAFNVAKKPFDDARVRRALNMAIDRKAIVDAAYGDGAVVAKNPIAPGMWSYNDDIRDYPTDLDKARKLLAEAGLAQGFETELWIGPQGDPIIPDPRRVAEMVQADLARIGVRVKIVARERPDFQKRTQAGEHPLALIAAIADNGDPDSVLGAQLACAGARPGGANLARWCDKEYDELVVQARASDDTAARAKLYEQAQVIFKEAAPWVTIAHTLDRVALAKNVRNYKMDALGLHRLRGLELTP